MAAGIDKIKEELENTYDILFTVTERMEKGEPCYYMGPENKDKMYFYIRVSFSNNIRITLEFIPDTYGGFFVNRMGEHPKEDRKNFLRFKDIMTDRGAKMQISINHNLVSNDEFMKYKGQWNQLSVRVTKLPISEDEQFSFTNAALEWGSLMIGMILSLADIVPLDGEESEEVEGAAEGTKTRVQTNRYERNPINRKLCLEKDGYTCCICGMNFENVYGDVGRNFIHVHHIVPVSQLGEDYVIDPEKDLVPVCPNCHAMLHRKNPPYTPEELRTILRQNDESRF